MKPGLKLSLLVLVCLFCGSRILAQDDGFYTPFHDDPAIVQELTRATWKQYRKDLDRYTGENEKQVEQVYRERYEKIRRMYLDGEIIADKNAVHYLQQLAKEITRHNPALEQLETRIVFSRSWLPNASNTGEGTILFNIGLFNRLRNESQAAFVLCHELAHLYLHHSDTSIARYVQYSKAYQRELKRFKKEGAGDIVETESFLNNLVLVSHRHSREDEMAADSLALEWLKNTSYDVREALTALSLLDSVDRDKYDTDPGLDRVLRYSEPATQWVKNNNEENPVDSLKTHPDCSVRIKRLKARVAKYYKDDSQAFLVDEALFKKLRRDFDYEIIEYCFRSGNISRSLYYTLQLLPANRSDAYLVSNTGRCLNEIYKAMKAHSLNKIVDPVTAANDKKYNKLLRYIHQLRLADVASISYFYLLIYQRDLSVHEDFLEALITSKINFNKPEEKKYWIEQYGKLFPDGKYKF